MLDVDFKPGDFGSFEGDLRWLLPLTRTVGDLGPGFIAGNVRNVWEVFPGAVRIPVRVVGKRLEDLGMLDVAAGMVLFDDKLSGTSLQKWLVDI